MLLCLVQVLASFLVQDLEAEGLNPFLLTYIANSLFMVYLPAYALAKRFASHGLKGRQATSQSIQPLSGHSIAQYACPRCFWSTAAQYVCLSAHGGACIWVTSPWRHSPSGQDVIIYFFEDKLPISIVCHR